MNIFQKLSVILANSRSQQSNLRKFFEGIYISFPNKSEKNKSKALNDFSFEQPDCESNFAGTAIKKDLKNNDNNTEKTLNDEEKDLIKKLVSNSPDGMFIKKPFLTKPVSKTQNNFNVRDYLK